MDTHTYIYTHTHTSVVGFKSKNSFSFSFNFLFYVGVELTYNAMLVSGVQQSNSGVYMFNT